MGVALWTCLTHPTFNISCPKLCTGSSWHRKELPAQTRECRCEQQCPHTVTPPLARGWGPGIDPAEILGSSSPYHLEMGLEPSSPYHLGMGLESSSPYHLGMGTVRILLSSPFGRLSLFFQASGTGQSPGSSLSSSFLSLHIEGPRSSCLGRC